MASNAAREKRARSHTISIINNSCLKDIFKKKLKRPNERGGTERYWKKLRGEAFIILAAKVKFEDWLNDPTESFSVKEIPTKIVKMCLSEKENYATTFKYDRKKLTVFYVKSDEEERSSTEEEDDTPENEEKNEPSDENKDGYYYSRFLKETVKMINHNKLLHRTVTMNEGEASITENRIEDPGNSDLIKYMVINIMTISDVIFLRIKRQQVKDKLKKMLDSKTDMNIVIHERQKENELAVKIHNIQKGLREHGVTRRDIKFITEYPEVLLDVAMEHRLGGDEWKEWKNKNIV